MIAILLLLLLVVILAGLGAMVFSFARGAALRPLVESPTELSDLRQRLADVEAVQGDILEQLERLNAQQTFTTKLLDDRTSPPDV